MWEMKGRGDHTGINLVKEREMKKRGYHRGINMVKSLQFIVL